MWLIKSISGCMCRCMFHVSFDIEEDVYGELPEASEAEDDMLDQAFQLILLVAVRFWFRRSTKGSLCNCRRRRYD